MDFNKKIILSTQERATRELTIILSSPLVSVIITTHNRPDLLKRTIQSVVKQTYENLEIIVIDDGSEQYANQMSQEFGDKRIICHPNTRTKGAYSSRNTGIELATGEFYTGLDDDDSFHPERIAVLMREYDPKYSFIASNTLITHLNKSHFRERKSIDLNAILWGNCVSNQILTKIYKIRSVSGFDETLTSSQDRDLITRMIGKWSPTLRIIEPLYNLDVDHNNSRINNSPNKVSGLEKFLQLHYDQMNFPQRLIQCVRINKYNKRPYLNLIIFSFLFIKT